MYNKAAHMVVHPGFSTKAEQEGSASSQFFPPLVKVCILLHPPTLHRKLQAPMQEIFKACIWAGQCLNPCCTMCFLVQSL